MYDQDVYKRMTIGNTKPIAFSTPLSKLNTSRPLPQFLEYDNKKLFQFKRNRPFNGRTLHPKSPVKSAPPISRVFPHRNWAVEKPHAISFRAAEDQTIDSALCSRFYNSDSSELYFEQCFTIEKKLGEGSFGEVMQVKSRDTEQCYAVKRSRERFKNESDRRRKLDEVKKHEKLPDHCNCVKFIKAWEEKQRLYIQTELCTMSLQGYMEKHHYIPIYFIWKYLIDLLHGLEHIHSHGFIHFDVKPANIFLTVDGTCKIGDFGLVVDRSNDDIEDAREGDNKYMAPELLNGIFSEKADVFSLGIAILEIACDLDLPSSGLSWQLLRSGYFPKECKVSLSLQTIIQWMMSPNYDERPTISQVLNHPIVIFQKRRLKVILFFHKLLKSVIGWITFALLSVLCATILFPLKAVKRPLFRKPLPKKVNSKSYVKSWEESSLSSNHSPPLSCELIDGFSESTGASDKGHSVITPNMTPHCFTPTPRNSSPLAHRTGNISRLSPDLSPLSRNIGNRSYKKHSVGQSKLFEAAPGHDFFVSDNSDFEHSEDDNDDFKVLSSRPRNLLNLLNDVSDSDHSNNAPDG